MPATPPKKSSSATALTATTATAPQRSHLTIKQKIAIIQKKFEEPKWTQERLGRWAKERFQLQKQPTQATVSNILKTREQLMRASISQDFCRVRAVKYPELDAAVHTWVLSLERNGIRFSSEDIKEKAQQLVKQLQLPRDLSFSNGWVASFMERHQLKLRKSQLQQQRAGVGGTSSSIAQRFDAESLSTVSSQGSGSFTAHETQPGVTTVRTHCQVDFHTQHEDLLANYAPRDVFSVDEVGLFYCMEPKRTKARRVSLPANSKSKVRIALALAVNMDASEKLEQFFVGTEQYPPCFGDKSAGQMHFSQYYYNSGAWVTGPIFQDWVLQLNHAMLEQNRRVLLIVDDAPSHVQMELSNVKTLVLPPKRPHPFGVGIVRTFKTLFRIRHLAHAADQAELGSDNVFEVDQLQAMRWAKQAWLEVSTDVIRKCWDHTGLSKGVETAVIAPSFSASASAVRMSQDMEDAICGFLAHLNLLYQVSIESILNPTREDDVHYIYNDATIGDLVVQKSGQEDAKDAAATWGCSNDEETVASAVDARDQDEQPPPSPPLPLKKRKVVVSDKRKADLYRDVIAVLDDESEIDEQLVHVIQFLRRKQAAARQEMKQQSSQSAGESAWHHITKMSAAHPPPPSRSSVTALEEAKDAQEPMAMMLI